MALEVVVAVLIHERRTATESRKTIFMTKFLIAVVDSTLQTCRKTTTITKGIATRFEPRNFQIFIPVGLGYENKCVEKLVSCKLAQD